MRIHISTYKFGLIAFVLLFSLQSIAQPGKSRQSWKENYQIAQALLAESSYYNATNYLVKALELKGSEDVDLMYLTAKTFMNARDYENAAYYFGLVSKNDSQNKFGDAGWYYAQMLKQSGKYNEALGVFASMSDDGNDSHLLENEMEGCQMALSGKESEILNYGEISEINTAYTEYAPMPMDDGSFMYSSLQSDELILTHENMVYSKIFKTRAKDGQVDGKGEALSETINKPDFHNGHGTYSDDSRRFYFTRCEPQPDHLPDCKIYVTTLRGSQWSEARLLGPNINNSNGSSSNPFFKEGKLYFSSDRNGGFGGMDLWVAVANSDGSFSFAKNMGRRINTKGDEITPFYDANIGTLYFSSNGHPNYGGFDVFKANNVDGTGNWSKSENMYYPINSSADDMYFVLDNTSSRAYFTSNRAGAKAVDNETCCDDIFTAKLDTEAKSVDVEGFVYHKGKKELGPLSNALVELYEIQPDGQRILVDEVTTQGIEPYQFKLSPAYNYVIKATKNEYNPGETTINPKGFKNIKQDVEVAKGCIELSGYVYMDDSKSKKVLEGAIVRLIETDEFGNERIVTETVSTVNGYILCVPKDKNMRMVISKDGALTDAYNVNTMGANRPERFDAVLRKNEIGIGFKIDNILYDFNSSYLRGASEIELDKIYEIMILNPSIILEMGSHTDNKGSVDYNLELSNKRAMRCVDYLKTRGIPDNRLKFHGYGELEPIAPNRNPDGSDNPSGRQLNRRTEFKIIGKLNN